jgi:hypothetical protein
MRWPAQEGGDFDIGYLTARRRIRLMLDEGQAGRGVAGKEAEMRRQQLANAQMGVHSGFPGKTWTPTEKKPR